MYEREETVTIVGLNYAPEVTGIAPYTTGLATAMKDAGTSVRVIAGYPHYPAWRIEPGYAGRAMTETIDGVRIERVRQYMPKNLNFLSRLLLEISFGIKSYRKFGGDSGPIVMVSPALFACMTFLLLSRVRRRKNPVGLWVQDLYSKGISETTNMPSIIGVIVRWLESSTFKMATSVVVIHPRFKDYLVNNLGVSANSVVVIRNWSHLTRRSTEPTRDARAVLGWGQDEIVVLHTGNMGAKQDLVNVVNAARYADQSGSNLRFVLVGDGNQRDLIAREAEGVASLDLVEQLQDQEYWSALICADILLVNEKPGVSDMAVPSKLTSYFAAGRPVIAATEVASTTASEMREAEAGVRIDPGDPRALVDAALRLGNDKALAELFGQNGTRFLERNLSPTTASQKLAEWIGTLRTEGEVNAR